MIPTWIVAVTLMFSVVMGFLGGLAWQGRSHRSAHSFYDPAVSVSATIDRATRASGDDKPDCSDDEYEVENESSDDIGDDEPESETSHPLETDGPVVRYYFAERHRREEYDPHKTARMQPERAPQPDPQNHQSRTGTRDRPNIGHAFRHHADTAHPVRKRV